MSASATIYGENKFRIATLPDQAELNRYAAYVQWCEENDFPEAGFADWRRTVRSISESLAC